MSEPWICPKCKRGVAPGVEFCDHDKRTSEVYVGVDGFKIISQPHHIFLESGTISVTTPRA